MEGPLHDSQWMGHAAMLDRRDWLVEEGRMLYLFLFSAAVPFSQPLLSCSWPECGWGSEKAGDWMGVIKSYMDCALNSLSRPRIHLAPSPLSFFSLALHFIHLFFSCSLFHFFAYLFLFSHTCCWNLLCWNNWWPVWVIHIQYMNIKQIWTTNTGCLACGI